MSKILLTGASGFIGSNILKELSQNNQIFTIVRKKPAQKKISHKNIIIIKFNDYDDLNKKLKKLNIDVVIHCATHYVKKHTYKDIQKLVSSNILLGNVILENLNQMKVKKFINFSTVWQDPHPKKDDFQNLYAAYKSGFNRIMNFYKKILPNVKFFEIVLSDTFGYDDKRNKLINSLRNNFLANKTSTIISKNLYINLLNIDDIIRGLMMILKKTSRPGQYVFKNFNDLRIFDLIKTFNKLNTNKIKVKWLSTRVIKNKIIKYDQLKPWVPKKSDVKDIIKYIKIRKKKYEKNLLW